MAHPPEHSPTFARFIAPLQEFIDSAEHQYRCRAVPDSEWIHAGLERVAGDQRSGCEFIQQRVLRDITHLKKSNYFESCKSTRRYRHLNGICEAFLYHHSQASLKENNLFEGLDRVNKLLADFHIYAGDGHFHAASSHDSRDDRDTKNAIGHLYALNLRNQDLSHLRLGSDGTCKKPHDMGQLKKLDIAQLRQGARKGQKVLYIWDRAGIDFQQWHAWKHNNAIYFISRTKENMRLRQPLPLDYDRDDPVNAGVLADEHVSHSGGATIRRVTFRSPETGEAMEFLTDLGGTIPPGVVAQLYYMRWRIEKSFDEIKNKLHETKAWAMSPTAKRMQAVFIVLAYNLAHRLHEMAQPEEDDRSDPPEHLDKANHDKREKRLAELTVRTNARGDGMPLLRKIYQRPSQLSVKFYRWLRKHIYDQASWREAQARLRLIYAHF